MSNKVIRHIPYELITLISLGPTCFCLFVSVSLIILARGLSLLLIFFQKAPLGFIDPPPPSILLISAINFSISFLLPTWGLICFFSSFIKWKPRALILVLCLLMLPFKTVHFSLSRALTEA